MGRPKRRLRILLVDDNESIRDALSDLLTDEGHAVVAVAGAIEALGNLGAAPDLIITDLMMPGIDGAAFLATVRERPLWKEVPALLITTCRRSEAEGALLAVGVAAAVLQKPFSFEELLHAIDECTTPRRGGRRNRSRPR